MKSKIVWPSPLNSTPRGLSCREKYRITVVLKGQCHEIFDYWFFHESVSPKHLSTVYHFGHFEFFRKFPEIFAAHGVPPVSLTPLAIRKIVIILGSRDNIYINFCLQVHFKVSAALCCSHYLPPVSTSQAELVAKFAAGVVDTGDNLQPVSLIPAAILPPVSFFWHRWQICHRLTCDYLREFSKWP
jgi:hypothetical protein